MRFLLIILLLALPLQPVGAQNIPVYQSGGATTGHLAMFGTNGVIADAGKSPGGPPGVNPNNLNITGPNDPFCLNDAPITSTGGYHQICLGFGATPSNQFEFVMNSIAGATQLPCVFIINGSTVPCVGAATGAVTVPNTATLRAKSLVGFTGVVIRVTPYASTTYAPAPAGACTSDDGGACVAANGGGFWQAQFSGAAPPQAWGAVGDGTYNGSTGTDNAVALQAWLNYGAKGHALYLPCGTYMTSAGLAENQLVTNLSIQGAGSGCAGVRYFGTGTTTDILALGTISGGQSSGVVLSGFRVSSATTMTAGLGLHLRAVVNAKLTDVDMDSQYGDHHLWNGWGCEACSTVEYGRFQDQALNDVVQLYGNATAANTQTVDMRVYAGKIASGTVGIHVGGGAQGISFDNSVDVIANATNMLVDNALAPTLHNNQLFFGNTVYFDTPTVSNIVINQSVAPTQGQITINAWVSSAPDYGVDVENCSGCEISLSGGQILGNAEDGIRIATGSGIGRIDINEPVWNNGFTSGYGIECVSATLLHSLGIPPVNNGPGVPGSPTNVSANCNINNLASYEQGNPLTLAPGTSVPAMVSGLVAGGVLQFIVKNTDTTSGAQAQIIAETGDANGNIQVDAQHSGLQGLIKTGTGFTGGLTISTGAGPLNFNPTGALEISGTAGVSCTAGTVSLTTLVVTKGIVTHC